MVIHLLSITLPPMYVHVLVSHFLQFSYLFFNPLSFSPSFSLSLSVIFQSPICLYIALFVFYFSPSIFIAYIHTYLSCVIFCFAQSNGKITRSPDKNPRIYACLSVLVLSFSHSLSLSLSLFLSLSSLARMSASIDGHTFIVNYTSRYVCVPFLTI